MRYRKELEKLDFFKDEKAALLSWLRTKAIDWVHEKEMRILFDDFPLKEDGTSLISFDPSAVESIYFGSRMTGEVEASIAQTIVSKYPNARIFKARPDPRNYNLLFFDFEQCLVF